MRLTELLALPVVDGTGASAGAVRDVRTQVHHDEDEGIVRIDIVGLIAGRGAVGERFGYAYGQARGPWVLAAPMRWIARHTRYVPWGRVDGVGDASVAISGSVEDLQPVVSVEEHGS